VWVLVDEAADLVATNLFNVYIRFNLVDWHQDQTQKNKCLHLDL
jgi:hypothetical protein